MERVTWAEGQVSCVTRLSASTMRRLRENGVPSLQSCESVEISALYGAAAAPTLGRLK